MPENVVAKSMKKDNVTEYVSDIKAGKNVKKEDKKIIIKIYGMNIVNVEKFSNGLLFSLWLKV